MNVQFSNPSDYTPLKIKDLKEGDRVILTHPDPHYNLGPANPAMGQEEFCVGTVVGVNNVRWDNGGQNNYKDFELSKVDDKNMVSIW